jgi:hypothetical protein
VWRIFACAIEEGALTTAYRGILVLLAISCSVATAAAGAESVGASESAQAALTSAPSVVGCPTSLDAWKTWRDQSIKSLLRPRLREAEIYIDRSQVTAQSVIISNVIDDCYPRYANPAELDGVIGTLRSFTDLLRSNLSIPKFDHQFGYTIDDFSYLEEVRENIELPELLRSAEFLRNISTPAGYKAAYDKILRHNRPLPADRKWIVLLYKSRFLPSPDASNTFGRFFVYVPEEKFDKWIQFGLKIPGDITNTPTNNISIVSVARPDSLGRRFRAIVDLWMVYGSGSGVKLDTRRESRGVTENCITCHKTSPLGIHPAEEYVFDGSGRLTVNMVSAGKIPAQLNALIPSYGPPYFNGWADTARYGPPLGPDIERDDAFMQVCTAGLGLDAASTARVEANMGCADCHSASGIGPLNYPQAVRQSRTAENQIYQYIVQGWMPPNTTLTGGEREGLFQCLMREYLDLSKIEGQLVDWLKNEPDVVRTR